MELLEITLASAVTVPAVLVARMQFTVIVVAAAFTVLFMMVLPFTRQVVEVPVANQLMGVALAFTFPDISLPLIF